MNDGASDNDAEKSSYDGISERPPDVDSVKEDPDIRRELYDGSVLRCSPSVLDPGKRRSSTGMASSAVYAWPMFMSVSRFCTPNPSPGAFEAHPPAIGVR